MNLLANNTTIIDDTQFRFPVSTADLQAFEAAHGKVTAANYEEFCAAVKQGLPDVMVGTSEMIDVCAALEESGAPVYRVA